MVHEEGVQFVYAPALYPSSPLAGKNVFVHGKVSGIKKRTGETILVGTDEKGAWEGYTGKMMEEIKIGENVRAYGKIIPQPDEKNVLLIHWIKKIEENEYAYCEKQTREEWAKIVAENPVLETLAPFVPTIPANPLTQDEKTEKGEQSEKNDPDFVPASELKIEEDYI